MTIEELVMTVTCEVETSIPMPVTNCPINISCDIMPEIVNINMQGYTPAIYEMLSPRSKVFLVKNIMSCCCIVSGLEDKALVLVSSHKNGKMH